jgi:hypothetical protein
MNQTATPIVGNNECPQPGPLDRKLLLLLTSAKLLIHVLTSYRYGHFRDELYFLDCARHLDWGYLDHAPLIALYAKISLLLGGSLPALRVLPAIAGAATVALAMLIARQLGGRRFAQGLTGLCVISAPIYLAIGGLLTMNAFEPLFWIGCIYLLIPIAQTDDSRLWILRCTDGCSMSLPVRSMVQQHNTHSAKCILCETCVDNCRQGSIRYAFIYGIDIAD